MDQFRTFFFGWRIVSHEYLFVSPEKVAQDQYRHGAIFRFAGALLLLGIVLQLPCLFCVLSFWMEVRDRNAEQISLRKEFDELQKANAPLKEIRQKLAQIRQWQPNKAPVCDNLPRNGCV